ncbi:MAG TPA: TIM barrel protein [Bryobacteraceae bacterium]|nr:TIM barrel protein [Bryobacteraceae bacterium]
MPFARMLAGQGSGTDKTAKLACNSWPFRGYFDTPEMHQYRDPKLPLITQAEFPEFLADHFGIHNVEFLPQHFSDTQPATIDRVKAGLKKSQSQCCNLMGVEIPHGVYAQGADVETVKREAQRWTTVALALGSPSITVALTGHGPANANVGAERLKPFVDIVHGQGIKVLFHNDSMQLESAETLTSVIKQLGRDKTGTCPDFGNFATKSAAYALSQLKMLAPFASNICHSKDGIADDGKFYPDDFKASMKAMRDTGFAGIYSLEFEGLGDPLPGVRKLMEQTAACL